MKNNKAMLSLFEDKFFIKGYRKTKVHIGSDVFIIGRLSFNKDKKEYHRCLYKNGKLFKDIVGIYEILEQLTHRDLLKIYILTNVLDDINKWEFDLNTIPNTETLKVIYDNGTVKNINFNEVFEAIEITKTFDNSNYLTETLPHKAIVRPVAYRIPTI
jgi:hypothetical protein